MKIIKRLIDWIKSLFRRKGVIYFDDPVIIDENSNFFIEIDANKNYDIVLRGSTKEDEKTKKNN